MTSCKLILYKHVSRFLSFRAYSLNSRFLIKLYSAVRHGKIHFTLSSSSLLFYFLSFNCFIFISTFSSIDLSLRLFNLISSNNNKLSSTSILAITFAYTNNELISFGFCRYILLKYFTDSLCFFSLYFKIPIP